MNPFVQAASFCVLPYSFSCYVQSCKVATERKEQVAEPGITQGHCELSTARRVTYPNVLRAAETT